MTATKVYGRAIIDGAIWQLYVLATDGTAIEITAKGLDGNLKNLKDILPGSTMTAFHLSVGTPSDLDLVQFKDDTGGLMFEWIGAINAALGHAPQLVVDNISVPITSGCAFEVTTSD